MVNGERHVRDVVAIGGSAGAIEALHVLLAELPPDLRSVLTVVIHRNPFVPSRLAVVLQRVASLPVVEPEDRDPIDGGRIYLAPRDLHMTVHEDHIRLRRDPKQHRMRPAVDPLFHSAALAFGRRVVGVLLSGAGQDGVSGLVAIRSQGGIALVQDPDEATIGAMPRKAIAGDDIDGVLSVAELARAIATLAEGGTIDGGPRGPRG